MPCASCSQWPTCTRGESPIDTTTLRQPLTASLSPSLIRATTDSSSGGMGSWLELLLLWYVFGRKRCSFLPNYVLNIASSCIKYCVNILVLNSQIVNVLKSKSSFASVKWQRDRHQLSHYLRNLPNTSIEAYGKPITRKTIIVKTVKPDYITKYFLFKSFRMHILLHNCIIKCNY